MLLAAWDQMVMLVIRPRESALCFSSSPLTDDASEGPGWKHFTAGSGSDDLSALQAKYTLKLLGLHIISITFHLRSASYVVPPASTVNLQLQFGSSWQVMQTQCVSEVVNYNQPPAKGQTSRYITQ